MYRPAVFTHTEDDDKLVHQARRQGGFEGVRANPPFDLQKNLYTPVNCTF